MSYDEENGRAEEQVGAPSVEEHGMGSFGENRDAARIRAKSPSFAPAQLELFRGTGYELIPLNAWNACDKDGRLIGKAPGKGWRTMAPIDVDEAREVLDIHCNVGVRLRTVDLVVDVDPRNFAAGDDPLKRLGADLGIDLSDYPTVVTGSGGKHIYMLKPEHELVVNELPGYRGVEFKALGRQVVAPGSVHPDTGEAYRWDSDPLAVGIGSVKLAPAALIDAIRRTSKSAAASEPGDIEPEQLAQMLAVVPAEAYREHGLWLGLAMGCHHATAGTGREEFIAWSISDPAYSGHAEIVSRRWDGFDANKPGYTKATLFKALKDAGRPDLIPCTPRSSAEEDFADDLADGVVHTPDTPRNGVADEWVYVIDAEAFVRRSDAKKWKKEQFKAKYAGAWNGDIVNAVFKGSLPMRKFDALIYVPGAAEFPEGEKGSTYNIWKPSGVAPKAGDVTPFLNHIAYLFEDEAECGYVLDYLAMLVQRPEQKVNYALLVKGGQGTGKSWIGRLMTTIIGSRNVTLPSNSEVMSNWTAWTEGAQLAIIEELMTRGRMDMANRLKPIITEPTLRIESKNCNLYSIPNHLNLMAFTNHEDAVPIEHGDRRWLVLFSEAKPRDEAYYERLFEFLEGDGPAAVKQWLLDRTIGISPKGMAPRTKGKMEMRRLSLSESEQHLAEMLEDVAAPFDFDLVRLEDLIDAVPAAMQRQTRGIRNRVARWLQDEVGAVKHTRYTKQAGSERPSFQLWSIRNHEKWAAAGAAARIDAFLDHAKNA